MTTYFRVYCSGVLCYDFRPFGVAFATKAEAVAEAEAHRDEATHQVDHEGCEEPFVVRVCEVQSTTVFICG